ncbi:MAG: ABC transporter permease [Vampirovibrionales bacterium]|nr:ABC transporter permease [Vampirovibrionales bacterium]
MTIPIEYAIAARYVKANLRQSLIIMLAVGIGVALTIFIPSLNIGFFNYLLIKTVETNPHIKLTRELETMPQDKALLQAHFKAFKKTVSQPRLIFSDQTQKRRRTIQAYRPLINKLEAFPGVTIVSPTIREQVIIVHGSQSRSAGLQGVLPEREDRIARINEHVIAGQFNKMGPQDVFLGRELADELDVDPGSRVKIVTAYGQRSFRVAGLIQTGMATADLSLLYMPLKSAQKLLQLENTVTDIGLKIDDIYAADTVAQTLAQAYRLKAKSWMLESKVFLDQIQNFRVIVGIINFLIVFAAATSITSILVMMVAAKSREIGILKAMGLSPGAIMRLFISQGLCLSVFGCIAGFFGALGLIMLYNASPLSQGATVLGIERPPTVINGEYTVLAFVYAMISSFLASLFPAWYASRLDPVKAMNQP